MLDFKFNPQTKRFESPTGESLTLAEFRARAREQFAKPVAPGRGRREREDHGNGYGFTRSKRKGLR